jgi:SPP1 gp7 family putative phage head morphogenesis protein
MTTVNEDIQDSIIRHMVWLERYKSSVVKKVLIALNKADADLNAQIASRLAMIEERGHDLGKATTKRLKSLKNAIEQDRKDIFKALYSQTELELKDFAVYEAGFQINVIEGAAVVDMSRPSKSLIVGAVTKKPFQGRLLREWFNGLGVQSAQRIKDAVTMGIIEGQTTDQIVRRIRGTRSQQYKNGVLDISRRDGQSVIRTAVAHVADRVANDVWDANADIVKGLKWVSTLDARTSAICRGRDGKIYKVGTAPPIPAHFNCRSRTIPYLGEFKTKGLRVSSGGAVPEDVNYGDWLRKQPVSVQQEVLGVKKAELFRKGGLPIDRFTDKTGREYTLDELRIRDNKAWNKVFTE